jgi:hypothetical protein
MFIQHPISCDRGSASRARKLSARSAEWQVHVGSCIPTSENTPSVLKNSLGARFRPRSGTKTPVLGRFEPDLWSLSAQSPLFQHADPFHALGRIARALCPSTSARRTGRSWETYSTALSARRMRSATSSGCETPTVWDAPSISTTSRAWARSAMKRWTAAGMFLSSSPNTNHDGSDFHAGGSAGLV